MVDFVIPHDPNWRHAFEVEADAIISALGAAHIELHHIGSTSIPDILAKPIIDLLGVVTNFQHLDKNSKKMETLGYEVMGAFGIEGRRYFRKFNEAGIRTHQLHVFPIGSPQIERHLAFRDFLIKHPKIASEYSDLKASLLLGGTTSWDEYLDGKDPFITKVEKQALVWFRENLKV